MFKFDKNYNNYWKKRVKKSTDGTKVPGSSVLKKLIENCEIKKTDKVLDVGCGYGRLFPILNELSSNIYGIDIDLSVINDASYFNYMSLHTATAENTKFPDSFFEKVIVFGVFDVVKQETALIEFNRILKYGGKCLITGKNIEYCIDDNKAFIAEKNAAAKNFPNHFTNIKKLALNIEKYGFSMENIFTAKRRGDFGNNKLMEITKNPNNDFIFYEYCIILKKIKSIINEKHVLKICNRVSKTFKKLNNLNH
jgi:SAM-dependent methyltransferase